jgi:hypothetical protein
LRDSRHGLWSRSWSILPIWKIPSRLMIGAIFSGVDTRNREISGTPWRPCTRPDVWITDRRSNSYHPGWPNSPQRPLPDAKREVFPDHRVADSHD